MLEELNKYKKANTSGSVGYVWRMEEDNFNNIKKMANENAVYPSVVVRYILDWALEKMKTDEEFRNRILEITLDRNLTTNHGRVKERKRYVLDEGVNTRLMIAVKEYRMTNISYFANECFRRYFEEKGI